MPTRKPMPPLTPRSNRIDDRLEALIVAQERFIGALTEAVTRLNRLVAQPIVSAGPLNSPATLWQAGAVLHQHNTTTHPVTASVGRDTPHSFDELMAKARESSVPRGTEPDDRALPLPILKREGQPATNGDGVACDAYGEPVMAEAQEPISDLHAALLDELAEMDDDQDLLPEPDEEGLWRKRLSLNALRLWQPEWGPRPGQAGCLVPDHLLNGRG